MESEGLNKSQLADRLGVEPSYITRWLRGVYPRVETMREVLGKLGWDLERARPEYDPVEHVIDLVRETSSHSSSKPPSYEDLVRQLHEHEEKRRPAPSTSGTIYAGTIRADGFQVSPPTKPSVLPAAARFFPTDCHDAESIRYYDIVGTSHASKYPEGCLVIVRHIKGNEELPGQFDAIVSMRSDPGTQYLRTVLRVDDVNGKSETRYLLLKPEKESDQRISSVANIYVNAIVIARWIAE